MAASTSDEDLWVYHEKQVSSLCGQHCINNLVQAASFSAPYLAEIAHELDTQERQHMLAEGADTPDALQFLAEESGNVDAAGNFSIQVLNTALQRVYGVYLVSAGSESVGKIATTGYDGENAFVLNRHAHWVAIRSIGGTYWDLNSMLDKPTRVTTFALEAYLHQLREDGYSVFVVRGSDLPPPASEPRGGSRDCWYRVKHLLEVSKGGKGSGALQTAATDVWLNSGPGKRLDGRSTSKSAAAGKGGRMTKEDMELAMAISASMGGDISRGAVGGGGGGGGDERGGGRGDEDDDVARAIAMSLSQEGTAAAPGIYAPQPVPDVEPMGSGVVRVQLRIGGSQRVVRGFRLSDPLTDLLDVAAAALSRSDGRSLAEPFDVVVPGGRTLLKAGVLVVGDNGEGGGGSAGEERSKGPTIGSERLGNSSVIVRRS